MRSCPADPAGDGAKPAPIPLESAQAAGLRYVSDTQPGIRRKRSGTGFSYIDADGKRDHRQEGHRPHPLARHPAGLDRRLDLPASPTATSRPPAATPAGASSTATTRGGARCATRPSSAACSPSAQALPAIRKRVERDLSRPGSAAREGAGHGGAAAGEHPHPRRQRGVRPRQQVLRPDHAADRHVEISGSKLRFQFRGKSGKTHEVALNDRRLARIVERCRDLPGQTLFQYLDEDGGPADDRLGRRERLPARDHRRGLHRQGLPHLGGNGPGGGCAAGAGAGGHGAGGEVG